MGNGDAPGLADLVMQPGGRTGAFVAENEAVTVGVLRIPIRPVRLGREQPEALGCRGIDAKRFPGVVMMNIQRVPIIHAGALQVTIGDLESERMNQVQP